MSRKTSRKFRISLEPAPASARRAAGGGVRASRRSRRLSLRIPNLHRRPAAERLMGRQQWAGHHPGRRSSQPRHPGPRKGYRAEPQ